MGKSSIEWTGETWNPTVGCVQISPGCANCYAKTLHDKRHKASLAGKKMPAQYAQPFEVLQMIDARLDMPLRKKKPTTFFVNSVSDLFHEDVPDDFIDRVFAVMALADRHTFQILTKRVERMRSYFNDAPSELIERVEARLWDMHTDDTTNAVGVWPLPNVWLGVSVENQRFADERIPLLLQTPAAIRFISAEPLLGPVLLDNGDTSWFTCMPYVQQREGTDCCMHRVEHGRGHFRGLDWVIVGGESGKGARGLDVAWVRSIVAQCQSAGVACFVKQLGAWPLSHQNENEHGGQYWIPLIDRTFQETGEYGCEGRGKKGDPAEWPEDLRVRQFPQAPSHSNGRS